MSLSSSLARPSAQESVRALKQQAHVACLAHLAAIAANDEDLQRETLGRYVAASMRLKAEASRFSPWLGTEVRRDL